MLFPLVVGLFGLVAMAAHLLLARLLRVRDLPFVALTTRAGAEPSTRARRLAVRLGAVLAVYPTLVLLFVLGTLGRGAVAPVVQVVPELPAARAGLQDGDRVLTIDGAPVPDFETLSARVQGHAGGPLQLTVQRGGQVHALAVLPEERRIGVGATGERAPASSAALLRCSVLPLQALAAQAQGLLRALAEPEVHTLGGPVAIVQHASAPSPGGRWLGLTFALARVGSLAWAVLLVLAVALALAVELRAGHAPRSAPRPATPSPAEHDSRALRTPGRPCALLRGCARLAGRNATRCRGRRHSPCLPRARERGAE